jgi:hypothetical protein
MVTTGPDYSLSVREKLFFDTVYPPPIINEITGRIYRSIIVPQKPHDGLLRSGLEAQPYAIKSKIFQTIVKYLSDYCGGARQWAVNELPSKAVIPNCKKSRNLA